MSLLKHYLKDRKTIIFLLVGYLAIWFSIFYLYRMKMDALLYGGVLTFVLVVVVMILDLIRYRNQHNTLASLQNEMNVSFVMQLKDTSLKGQDYKRIVQVMDDARRHAIEEKDEATKQNQDYFTLWAHQMKLPIAAMKLLFEDEVIDRKECRTQLLRIDQYTDMVLAYSRMNSISTDYLFREYELDDLIQQSIRRFSFEFIHRKISLDFQPTQSKVLTDEKWFVFVLEQLLSNALKYSDSGSKISIYYQDHKLYIQDEGKGISESDLERVFEKGYTGVNGRADKKASGLGLYLCKEICANLSHGILIESVLHKGTTVILDLNRYDLRPE